MTVQQGWTGTKIQPWHFLSRPVLYVISRHNIEVCKSCGVFSHTYYKGESRTKIDSYSNQPINLYSLLCQITTEVITRGGTRLKERTQNQTRGGCTDNYMQPSNLFVKWWHLLNKFICHEGWIKSLKRGLRPTSITLNWTSKICRCWKIKIINMKIFNKEVIMIKLFSNLRQNKLHNKLTKSRWRSQIWWMTQAP